MHPKTSQWRPLAWGLALAAGLLGSPGLSQPPADSPAVPSVKTDKTGTLLIPLGGVVRFEPDLPKDGQGRKVFPVEILVTRGDEVVQVRTDPKDPTVLLLAGRVPGLAQITLRFPNDPATGRPYADRRFDAIVQPDFELLRRLIRQTVPTSNVTVEPGLGNVVILGGYVTSPQDADIIARLANSAVGGNVNSVINAIQIGGVQQVQIDVVVASVNRSELRDRGFDFFVNGKSFQTGSFLNGFIPSSSVGTNAATVAVGGTIPFAVGGRFFGALQALRTENISKILAEPRVVTQTGRPAFFRSGGQQAILSPSSGITGPGVQLVPFGTELEVLPIVYGNGQIWLEINPRFSTPNPTLGINVGGATSVGFNEQQVRAAVMLESGQTYAIGGLIQNQVTAGAARIPLVGDIPFFGTAFSRTTHQVQETELIILVTPRLVHAMDCNQVPKRLPGMETRNPDDYELFLETVLEAPRGQRKVWNGLHYNAAYKCDPTISAFPCIGNVCNGPNLVGGAGSGICPGAGYPGTMSSGGYAPAGHGGAAPVVPAGPVGDATPPRQTLPPVTGSPVGTADPNGPVVVPEAPRY
jgi:pilus assembly protein CpaC